MEREGEGRNREVMRLARRRVRRDTALVIIGVADSAGGACMNLLPRVSREDQGAWRIRRRGSDQDGLMLRPSGWP